MTQFTTELLNFLAQKQDIDEFFLFFLPNYLTKVLLSKNMELGHLEYLLYLLQFLLLKKLKYTCLKILFYLSFTLPHCKKEDVRPLKTLLQVVAIKIFCTFFPLFLSQKVYVFLSFP